MRLAGPITALLTLALAVAARAEGACMGDKAACGDAAAVLIRPDGTVSFGGQPLTVIQTPTGMVGKVNGEKLVIHREGGTIIGRIGTRRLLCHTDPRMGLTLCK